MPAKKIPAKKTPPALIQALMADTALKRPQVEPGSSVTTPLAADMIRLLGGGVQHEGVTFSHDETRRLNKLYGYTPEAPRQRPPKPEPPHQGRLDYREEIDYKNAVNAWEGWTDPRAFFQAGADLHMARSALHDGLRLVAWLARYVPAGTDPLKTLIQAVSQAGWTDVDWADVAWANDEEVSDEKDDA